MPAPTAVVGQLLEGRYRLAEVVGVGGMATVYRARDDVLARDVAVKLFPPTGSADDQERQRAEISVLAKLNHPGLVSLLDAGSFGNGVAGQTYIVMELVRGPTLADVLAEGPLEPEQAAVLGAQLATALVAVHDAGVVHRDVKPANVLVCDAAWRREHAGGPPVKLADFGIARIADAARLTATGTTLGTATYLSPEQAVGGAVGPPTDVYALGLVLLECLTGHRAFTGTVAEVAAARLTADPDIPATVGRPWATLLRRMTCRDASDRPTAAESAAWLADLAARAEPTLVLARPHATAPLPATAPVAAAAAETVPDGVAAAGVRRRAERSAAGWPWRSRRAIAAAGVLLAASVAAGAALWPEPAPAGRSGVEVSPELGGPLGDATRDLVTSVEP